MTCTIDQTCHCAFDDDYALSVAACSQALSKIYSEPADPPRSSWETAQISTSSCSASYTSIAAIPGLALVALCSKGLGDYASDRTTEVGDASPRSILSACDEPCDIEIPPEPLAPTSCQARRLPKRWAEMSDSDQEEQVPSDLKNPEKEDDTGRQLSTRPSRASRRARRAAAQNAERDEAGKKWEADDDNWSHSYNAKGSAKNVTIWSKVEAKGVGKAAPKSTGKGVSKPDADREFGKGGTKGSGKDFCKGKNANKGQNKGESKGSVNGKGGKGKGRADAGKGAIDAGFEKFQCQILIGIEEDSKFRVVRRMIGSGGEHMKNIAEESGAKLRLRGRGSKFLEGPMQQESEDELMLCISATTKEGYDKATEKATELIEGIHQHYRAYCRKARITCPTLRVQVHEGYRPGSR